MTCPRNLGVVPVMTRGRLRIQYCLVSKLLEAKINHNSSYKQAFTLKHANRGKAWGLNKADTKMWEGGRNSNETFKPLQQQVQQKAGIQLKMLKTRKVLCRH